MPMVSLFALFAFAFSYAQDVYCHRKLNSFATEKWWSE